MARLGCRGGGGSATAALLLLVLSLAAAVQPSQAYLSLPPPMGPACTSVYAANKGDTCAKIAKASGVPLLQLQLLNAPQKLSCDSSTPITAGKLVCTSASYTAACGPNVVQAVGGQTCKLLAELTAWADIHGQPQFYLNNALVAGLNPGVCRAPLGAGTPVCLPAPPGFIDPNQWRDRAESASHGRSSHARIRSTKGSIETRTKTHANTRAKTRGKNRRLQQLATSPYTPSDCVGNQYSVQASDSVQSCADLAAAAGLSVPTLLYLNPTLQGTACTVGAGFPTCIGCTGTVCGTPLSDGMSALLTYPSAANQAACALLAACKFQGPPVLSGAPGTVNETLIITMNAPTSLAISSTFPAISSFFTPTTGAFYTTGPNPALEIDIHPYSNQADAVGYYAGLFEFYAVTQSSSRRLQAATGGHQRGLLATITTRQSQNPVTKLVSTYRL